MAQRQVHANRNVQKTIQIPQLQHTDQVVDVPVVVVAQVPQVHVVMKTVETPRVQIVAETTEIPQLPLVEKIEMIPEIQTIQGPQTSESLSIEGTVAEKTDHGIVMQSVVPNIGLDSFIDDLSSVGSQGSNRQDCEVLSHVGKQSGIQQQQHQDNNRQQPTRQVRQEKRGERGKERKGEREERRRKEEKPKKQSTSRSRRTRRVGQW